MLPVRTRQRPRFWRAQKNLNRYFDSKDNDQFTRRRFEVVVATKRRSDSARKGLPSMPREFNEEIVSSYYELQGYFVRMNVPYRPADDRNDSSDIDIVAVHPLEDKKCIACEVKGWHTGRFTMGTWRSWPQLLNFTCAPATAALRELTGDRMLQHVLVVPPINDQQRGGVEAHANQHNVELLEWPRLIREMISFIDVRRNARNQTDHVLRVLLKYGFLNAPGEP
ncbi:MAG: hypothetical protein JWR32_3616 [Mycobacterium sp.]|jgi:hypothetical protein|nr:hypothetical protein [Mycobacterium sp.]